MATFPSVASFAVESSDVRPLPRPSGDPPVEDTAVVEPEEATETDVVAEVEVSAEAPETSGRDPFPGTLIETSTPPRSRPATLLEGHEFRFSLRIAQRGDWTGALEMARRDGPVAASVIEWKKLRAGRGSFEEYRSFLAKNGDWPGLKLLRKRGERAILKDAFSDDVIAYFKPEPPQTGYGALRLIEAHAAKGDFSTSRALLVEAWKTMKMTAKEEAAFLADFGEVLKPYHEDRLDDALWREDAKSARRMLTFASDEAAQIALARLALQGRAGNADALWKAIPDEHARHPGLSKDRMRWLIAKKKRGEAGDLIIAQSTSRKSLGRPAAWSEWRAILARQAMRDGNPNRAYQLSSTHFLDGGSDYADLEWLSGYLALQFRNEPSRALTHFRHFRSEVYTPISLGRAGYWEGRALDAMGDMDAAMESYRDGGQHQTSFYGLLAAERAGLEMDPEMAAVGPGSDWTSRAFYKTSVFQAAELFHRAGDQYQYEVTRFLRHLSEITAKDELVALGDFTMSLGNPYIAVRVGKQIAREGAISYRAYYPLTDLGQDTLPVEEALALAIARRESEFFKGAISHAGARGLMQLMPGTARDMARKVGVPYAKARLTADPVYNVRLGSAYLDHLIDEFGNNVALVSVGYNAGPHRARRWIEANGDPRLAGVDVVDWVEHIPFNETRNYVMRVAESLPVYRARLTGKTAPISITKELKSR